MLASLQGKDKDVQVAIAGSMAFHLIVLAVLVWQWTAELTEQWMARNRQQTMPLPTLLYPDEVMEILPPPPPPPKEDPAQYIRTTQNTEAEQAPEKPAFISDRDTEAASEMAPDPDGEGDLPTMTGIDKPMLELADRDFKDGEAAEDGATPVPPMKMSVPQMTAPGEDLSILKPEPKPPGVPDPTPPVPPPSPPPAPPKPELVELAKSEIRTPLEMMMREMDEEVPELSVNRPDSEDPPPQEAMDDDPATPDRMPAEPRPEGAETAASSPPRAIPVEDPVMKTAGPQDAAAFSPFTRTSAAKGTISNRGDAAVDAAATPVGRYMRQVTSAVERRWHVLRRQNADAVTFGNLKLKFVVTKTGRVEPPRILSDRNAADARMIDFTLQAILEAEIPPIPENLIPLLDNERLEVEYDVLIY